MTKNDLELIITELQTENLHLKTENQHLQEINTLKNDFVSIASHELRTPLTATKNYLWLLLHQPTLSPEQTAQFLQTAYNSTNRLIKLVSNLLTIAKIENKQLETNKSVFDLFNLIKDVEVELKTLAIKKHLNFKIILPPNISSLPIKGDASQIRQVLENILSNSFKFTTKGEVCLELKIKKSTKIEIIISDTGCGISLTDQKNIFGKFSQGENNSPPLNKNGTGLGLYISQEIIKNHQGYISVKSQPGQGSAFTIHLPLYPLLDV